MTEYRNKEIQRAAPTAPLFFNICLPVFCLSIHLCNNTRESFWIVSCKVSKHFAVDDNVLLGEFINEDTVGNTERSKSCVKAYSEEATHVSLLVFAVCKSMCSCMTECYFCFNFFFTASEAIPLCSLKNITAMLHCNDASFYS